jgi:hypothetical protein
MRSIGVAARTDQAATSGGLAAAAAALTSAPCATFKPSSTRGRQLGARALLLSAICADSTYCVSAGSVSASSLRDEVCLFLGGVRQHRGTIRSFFHARA